MFADVIIEYPVKSIDRTFIYKVPEKLLSIIKVGMKVLVPFNNKEINGFILGLSKLEPKVDYIIKEIIDIINPELILNEELLLLANYLQEVTLCPKIMAFQTMLPKGFKAGSKKNDYRLLIKYVKLNPDLDIKKIINSKKNAPKQLEIINKLRENKIMLKQDLASNSLNQLITSNIVLEVAEEQHRINKEKGIDNVKLTVDQEKVFLKIKESFDHYETFLLQGITGSGKTEVYIHLIKEIIKLNKRALMLVPEISLTTQIANRFYQVFGSDVAILHSSLSDGEKYDEYLKILNNEVHVVIGTRSAVFAPLNNLGIIIIDEEDSNSYKQENTPKYHAKDMAIFRAKYNNIPLVLGSATPSLEAKARADKKVYTLVSLNKRVNNAKLPIIHIVSMEEEMKKKNMIFSTLLMQKIQEKLIKKEQIILLLNRRGFSTYITCSNCGYTYKCPSCDITLTYHKTTNNLICHYCGYQVKKSDNCPKCGEDALNYYGLGTEKLESELQKKYPTARIIRMDQDNTQKKGMHEKIINAFLKQEYDILLGTQMVSKGLDFPNVSLVGVINADTTLNIPDFRSNENTFSLLSQVAGRAGRSNIEGEVIIQTYNPDNYVINCVKENDYQKFYLKEMQFRHRLKYPPYYYLVGIKIISKNYEIALEESHKIKDYLLKKIDPKTIILGPTTASILKYKNEYRFQIILKYQFDSKLKEVLKNLDNIYINNKNCYLDIDFNPINI